MPQSAVLFMDLQTDFLSTDMGRMPVDAADATRVLETANAILDGHALQGSLPIFVVNSFARSDRIANFFRRYAALAGSSGAELDARVHAPLQRHMVSKSQASAFTNPQLESLLREAKVTEVVVFGVFAEGCVLSTARDAHRLGFHVTVPVDAIGTNADWKRRFAMWSLRRTGVTLVPTLRPCTPVRTTGPMESRPSPHS